MSEGDNPVSSQVFYDSLAEDFRSQDTFWDNPYDCEIWRLEHDLLRPYLTNSGVLLDIGCGFYPHFEFASALVVVAGDISLKSLLVARRFGDELGVVKLCQFDPAQLPFASGSCSAVIAGGELLNHLVRYEPALAEIARVLDARGILMVQVSAKWCLDLLWALLDAVSGNWIGYAMKRDEAITFLRRPCQDSTVTWDITTSGPLKVQLLSIRHLRQALRDAGFKILMMCGANSLSGIIPLPLQQKSASRALRVAVSLLIRLDRTIGRILPFRGFAGNVFLLCRRYH